MVPAEPVRETIAALVDIMQRMVPIGRHAEVERELALLGARPSRNRAPVGLTSDRDGERISSG